MNRHRPAPPPDLPQGTVVGRSGGGSGWCRFKKDSLSNADIAGPHTAAAAPRRACYFDQTCWRRSIMPARCRHSARLPEAACICVSVVFMYLR